MTRYARTLLDPSAPFCPSGKRGHADEAAAERALRGARHVRRDDVTGGRIPGRREKGWYRCLACGWWHLRSATGRRRRGDYGHRDGRRKL